MPGAGLVVSGTQAQGGIASLVLWRLDADGNAIWKRVHRSQLWDPADLHAMPGYLHQHADGSFSLSAFGGVEGSDELFHYAVHADPSGHMSCKDAGVCAEKAMDDCDDGNPSTVDACHPSKGCMHTPISGL